MPIIPAATSNPPLGSGYGSRGNGAPLTEGGEPGARRKASAVPSISHRGGHAELPPAPRVSLGRRSTGMAASRHPVQPVTDRLGSRLSSPPAAKRGSPEPSRSGSTAVRRSTPARYGAHCHAPERPGADPLFPCRRCYMASRHTGSPELDDPTSGHLAPLAPLHLGRATHRPVRHGREGRCRPLAVSIHLDRDPSNSRRSGHEPKVGTRATS
jgi:hypothetical protein